MHVYDVGFLIEPSQPRPHACQPKPGTARMATRVQRFQWFCEFVQHCGNIAHEFRLFSHANSFLTPRTHQKSFTQPRQCELVRIATSSCHLFTLWRCEPWSYRRFHEIVHYKAKLSYRRLAQWLQCNRDSISGLQTNYQTHGWRKSLLSPIAG